MYDLKYYINLASVILNGDTEYSRGKRIISDIFKLDSKDRFETIFMRLSVIDSFYSTQMNKRLFALNNVAETLTNITKNDRSLIELCEEFIKNPSIKNGISSLLYKRYGIKKTGEDCGIAPSLITKYLYFLTKYNFPIYDALAYNSYQVILKKYPELKLREMSNYFSITYFENMIHLNNVSKINDLNKLDNFLWLMGKISSGSLSLILDEMTYFTLASRIFVEDRFIDKKTNKKYKSSNIDKVIREYIEENFDAFKGIFSKEEQKFFKYIFKISQ